MALTRTGGLHAGNPGVSSAFAGAEREALKREVRGILARAGEDNWDGEGALAVSPRTVEIAELAIDGFPRYVARPDVDATPRGEVDFDWAVSRNAMLTVSVGPSGEIAFAGLFGDARVSGSEIWSGELPRFVACCFERLRDTAGK